MLTMARLPLRHGGKLLDGLTQNPRTGGAKGMAERDAAAVRVHAIARKASEGMLDTGLRADEVFVFESFDVTEHLRRKRLVDFPKRDVVELQTVAREQPRESRTPGP